MTLFLPNVMILLTTYETGDTMIAHIDSIQYLSLSHHLLKRQGLFGDRSSIRAFRYLYCDRQ